MNIATKSTDAHTKNDHVVQFIVPDAAAPAPAAEAKEVCLCLPPCAAAAQSAYGIHIVPLACAQPAAHGAAVSLL